MKYEVGLALLVVLFGVALGVAVTCPRGDTPYRQALCARAHRVWHDDTCGGYEDAEH